MRIVTIYERASGHYRKKNITPPERACKTESENRVGTSAPFLFAALVHFRTYTQVVDI